MRFSYIDSQGKEIEVDSVESLALRIELGAIKPDTRMYDAVADRWAPAEEHPVFRSLSRGEEIEEEEILAIGQEEGGVPPPEADVEELAESPEVADGGDEVEEVAAAAREPEAEEPEVEEPSASGPSEEDPLGLAFEVSVAEEELDGVQEEAEATEEAEKEGALEEAETEGEVEGVEEIPAFESLGSLELEAEEPEEALAGEASAGEAADREPLPAPEEEELVAEAEEEPPVASGEEPQVEEEPEAEQGPEVEEESLPEPTWVDEGEALWEAEEPEAEDAPEAGRRGDTSGHRKALEEDLADPRRQMPAWAAGPGEAGEEVAEERAPPPRRGREPEIRRVETDERTFVPRPAHWDERRRARARRSRLVRVGQVAGVLLLAAGAGYVLFGPSEGPGAPEPTEVVAEPLLPPAQWAAMATAADRAWSDVLDEFRSVIPGYGLPYRPPPSWLEGIYLSNASDYPGVAEYWQGVDETVGDLQAREADLYFQYLNRRLERMAAASGDAVGASAAVSAGNVPRIIEVARMEYERTASARDSAYQELYDLAAASLDLHAFLMDREADILYEPFTDPGVSRDPVLEAVPVDSVLRVEMNSNLDQVIDAIVQSGIPRPITTAALFNHLLTDLAGTETASDTPPPPDTLES